MPMPERCNKCKRYPKIVINMASDNEIYNEIIVECNCDPDNIGFMAVSPVGLVDALEKGITHWNENNLEKKQ